MTIMYRPGKNHGNADAWYQSIQELVLVKIALIMVISLRRLNLLLRRNLEYWLQSERKVRTVLVIYIMPMSDEEIKDAQKWDPELLVYGITPRTHREPTI